MSDLDNFKAMLDRANVDFDEYSEREEWEENSTLSEWLPYLDSNVATVIIVMPGYRCHYESAFDANGNLLNTGQFGELWTNTLL